MSKSEFLESYLKKSEESFTVKKEEEVKDAPPAPKIDPKILLKSWAMPPASWATVSIFWICISCCSSFFFYVISCSVPVISIGVLP